ncbi:flavodoxin family protein [Methanospirillum stamsii]|uniref:Flavodoxin family protein n=1 Tax=Methanospirillum stamsii TaxID=1277351 RepID=A0A2V2N620_9EURY|nr:flavodoxin family protein [Methanospirillum stamsii]PWR75522.1 flavodoxin family protein [Methanospirillum stamsii]
MNPGKVTVIGVCGSPRRKGNTEQLLDSFLQGAADAGGEAEKIILSGLTYSSCKGCNACHLNGICIMDDDAKKLYDRLISADCIAISSPIYTMGITTELKSFIDRAHYLWVRHFLLDSHIITPDQKKLRRGYFLSTAGMDQEDVFDTTFPMLNALFNILGFSHCTDILAGNMDGYKGITGHPTALSDAYQEGNDAVKGINLQIPCNKQVKK